MLVQALVKQHPLLFRGIVPGTLAIGCGDVICQRLEGKEEASTLNHERTARMMITGCVCVTPLAYTIQRSVNRALPGRSLGELVKKAVANASSCVLIILGSFTGNNMLQGRGIEVLRAQLAERLAPTCALGLGYWTAAGLLLPQGVAAAFAANAVWSIAMSRALNIRTPAVSAAMAAERRAMQEEGKVAAAAMREEAESGHASSSAFLFRLQRAGQRQQQQHQQQHQQQQEHRH